MMLFFGYSFWAYKTITPDTGAENFFWMLIFRGLGMGLLFIPITTLSLSTLKGKQIGQGAAFTGMMRQLGGSFGVAIITVFLDRKNQIHRNDLVTALRMDDPMVRERVSILQNGFIAHGSSPDQALQQAYKALDYNVMKQANVLSYMDAFLYLGILFILCVPFVLMVKQKRGAVIKPAEPAH
jgi:MFS transporter, DHA2 family, multidrug resistance protein